MIVRHELEDFSYSQLAAWIKCPYAWHVSFNLGLKPRVDRPKPQLGTMVHAGIAAAIRAFYSKSEIKPAIAESVDAILENYYKQNMVVDKETGEMSLGLWEEEIVQLEERVDRAKKLSFRTFKYIKKNFEPVIIDGKLAVEYEFTIQLPDNLPPYHGTIDLVAKEKSTGYWWVIDHKVREQFQPDDDEQMNVQFASYQFALGEMGIKTVGSMALQIWWDLPRMPEMRLDGKGMKKSDIRTDWPTYKKALLKNGFNPDEYSDMELKLADKEFIHLSRDFRSPTTVLNFWDHIIMQAVKELSKPKKRVYRKMSAWNCKGCNHLDFCQAGLRGGDEENLLKYEYVKNDYAFKYKGVRNLTV